MTSLPFNYVQIDSMALANNFRVMGSRVAQGVRLMAMVKSDAYGHGLVPAAKAFAGAGADCFGVAEIEEGVLLRQAGLVGDIVVLLGFDPHGIGDIMSCQLSPVIFSEDIALSLSKEAVRRAKTCKVHLKVETGMNRFGILPEDAFKLASRVAELPGLELAGIMSHFPLADVAGGEEYSLEQWHALSRLACRIKTVLGAKERLLIHIANSAGIIVCPESHGDMVRPGISLYGYSPAEFIDAKKLGLLPAMSLRSRVMQLKEVAAGAGISYAHRFVSNKPTRLAVLPLGYADGYPRGLSNRGEVLIGGHRCPLRGNICMNACMAELPEGLQVEQGDEVVFMGRQGDGFIGADEIAALHGTISYEILCRFGAANRQVWA